MTPRLAAYPDWKTRAASVRQIVGTMSIHQELEQRLAAFKRTEAALVFQSGYAANLGVISALLGAEDAIVSDSLNHASIIDGARLSRARIHVFAHRDYGAMEKVLAEARAAVPAPRRVLAVTDGVFSMDGDVAELPRFLEVAEAAGAITMVDDAHASGVMGEAGRGTVDHFGLHGRVDIQVGTLSKALAALGGYVAGRQELRDWLIQRGRPFLFSTSHPPGVAAAAMAALEVLEAEPERIARLWENARFLKKGLLELGLDTGGSQSPITPVIAGKGETANRLSQRLLEEGVLARAIAYPVVARGRARVRTIVSAGHTRRQLELALDAFARVGMELGLRTSGARSA
jgi:glycine C-acetyltransferase